MPRAKSRALGKDLLCRGPPTETLGKIKALGKDAFGPRQRKALGKDALGNFSVLSNGSRAPSAFAEGHPSGPRQKFLIFFLQNSLPRAFPVALGKEFFFDF